MAPVIEPKFKVLRGETNETRDLERRDFALDREPAGSRPFGWDLRDDLGDAEALSRAFERVLHSGRYVLGPELLAFEQEMANYLGVAHTVGVSSGTDALWLSLLALEVGHLDEVLIPAFGFVAVAEVVARVGAIPRCVDIDPETFNLDPRLLRQHLTSRTKAILAVHLFGQACDLAPIVAFADQHGLAVIEDVAQACGATYQSRRLGSIGTLGCFSFYPTKNLAALGDGGLISTNDPGLAQRLRRLRNHGSEQKHHTVELGFNCRLDELQAAFLRVRLAGLPERLALRTRRAQDLSKRFADRGYVLPTEKFPERSWNQFVMRVRGESVETAQKKLAEEGYKTEVYYPYTLAELPYVGAQSPCPEAALAAKEVLALSCLPMTSPRKP